MLIHFDDYIKAIKDYIAIAMTGNRSRFIEKTTVVSLRKYCLYLFDEGLSNEDEKNFRLFFQVKKEEDLRAGIQKFDADKFRPIKNFIDGKTETPSQDNIELIAILLDFNPRPFNKFSKSNLIADDNPEKDNPIADDKKEDNSLERIKNEEATFKGEQLVSSPNDTIKQLPKNNLKKKVGIGVIALFGIFSVGYTAKDILFPEKQCMEWVGNHYELVNCQSEELGIATYKIIKPYNEIEFQRKKLKVCDTTTFEKNGKPVVWYSKKNNVVEFFNMDGVNPENNAETRKVSDIIIEKYVKPCE